MKRALFSLFLIFVFSCGVPKQYPLKENRVTIIYRDSTIEQESVYLLSVRDGSLIAAQDVSDKPIDILTRYARIITFDRIEAIHYQNDASFPEMLFPGIFGCIGGGAAGIAIAGTIPVHGNSEFINPTLLEGAAIGGVTGLAVGMVLGHIIGSSDKMLYLDTPSHIKEVRSHAYFQEIDPPELQKIR
jgi:hypothetical protein